MAIVSLDNISVTLAGRRVLRALCADVEAGQQVLLTGANGAGKTTLLRLVATAIRPRQGTLALFGGQSRAQLCAARARLALMTHQHFFYEPLTAMQNLALIDRLSHHSGEARRRALLERVGLWGHRHRPVANFSAGMKRRLALARVELLAPELILVDEPFGQLDPGGVALMHDALTSWAARGATVIMATHDIDRGRALCRLHWHIDPAQPGLVCRAVAPA